MTHKKYCENKTARLNTPGKIVNGQGFYYYNGLLIPEEKFYQMFPLPLFLNGHKENPDKRNNFIHDNY